MEKLMGHECPACGCRESVQLGESVRQIYQRRPGSSQLVLVAEETQLRRKCDHCGGQFRVNIKNASPPPRTIDGELQAACHHCGSPNVRELHSTMPTRSGVAYKKMHCRDCDRPFNLTTRRRQSA